MFLGPPTPTIIPVCLLLTFCIVFFCVCVFFFALSCLQPELICKEACVFVCFDLSQGHCYNIFSLKIQFVENKNATSSTISQPSPLQPPPMFSTNFKHCKLQCIVHYFNMPVQYFIIESIFIAGQIISQTQVENGEGIAIKSQYIQNKILCCLCQGSKLQMELI